MLCARLFTSLGLASYILSLVYNLDVVIILEKCKFEATPRSALMTKIVLQTQSPCVTVCRIWTQTLEDRQPLSTTPCYILFPSSCHGVQMGQGVPAAPADQADDCPHAAHPGPQCEGPVPSSPSPGQHARPRQGGEGGAPPTCLHPTGQRVQVHTWYAPMHHHYALSFDTSKVPVSPECAACIFAMAIAFRLTC